ncbi:MAG TPA: hypothetical protein VHF26_10295, partial [Trebonia sp.]|nr:hypothetical protein [Trebonia sp.]
AIPPPFAVPTPRPVPQTSGGHERQRPGPPSWPAAPPPRSRRRWTVLSALLTLAIVVGAGAYVWMRTHSPLTVSIVAVSVSNTSLGCNGTEHVTGTIHTNGHGGPITYEWIQGNEKNPAKLVVDDASGKDVVQVGLNWGFRGKGAIRAVARLQVLTPDQSGASITFPYSCPL